MSIRIFLVSILTAIAVAASAQITITQTSLATWMQTGGMFLTETGAPSQSVHVGAAQATTQMFDFSTLTFQPLVAQSTISPAATSTYKDSFPNAMIAVVENAGLRTTYTYYGLDAKALTVFGTVQPQGPMVVTSRNQPLDTALKFPTTYTSQWKYVSDTIVLPPNQKRVISTTYHVDAFGMIMLPGGVSQECLRIKEKTSTENISSQPPRTDTFTVYTYKYYLDNGMRVEASIDANQQDSSVATPRSITYWHPGVLGVDDSPLPTGLSLLQNYPNPFTSATTVDYAITQHANVRVDVVDMLGRTLSTVLNRAQDAGRYTVSLNGAVLPAGRYNCRVSVNGNAMNHAMVVVK